MSRLVRKMMGFCVPAILAVAAAGCSSDVGLSNVNLIPKPDSLKSDWLSFSGAKTDFELRPITANDLVSAEGQCAASANEAPPSGAADMPASQDNALLSGGIALQMSECDVVRRAGAPEKIDIGTAEGERSVVLLYSRGPRPGIYRFAGGRLYSIERGPQAAEPAKPQRQVKPAKKPSRA